ncbi:hypothetical protein AGMMS49949_03400 [Alphaproteobacteria bacterium]|nr:hypothetical protein AGMMS49949_03400 [Alphaproteobacteria bacterium]GHS96328.1 hypothetical protein AGMMS50296_2360 [Alphaproteobacteria bacterium]
MTSLGTFDNAGKVKARHLTVTSVGAVQNSGILESSLTREEDGNASMAFTLHDSFVNTGVLDAKVEKREARDLRKASVVLTMDSGKVFEQKGSLFRADVLSLKGKKWEFQNTTDMGVGEFRLEDEISFSHLDTLTEAELRTGVKDNNQAVFQNVVVGENYKGTWTNRGFLSLQSTQGTLATLRNDGILVSKNLSVQTFLQGGKAKVEGTLTVTEDLKQRGILSAKTLHVKQNGTNENKLVVQTLEGQGRFFQSGTLEATKGDNQSFLPLEISVKTFEQKKTLQEPRMDAGTVTFSGDTVTLGENSHLKTNTLVLTKKQGAFFTNHGLVHATVLLDTARTVQNDGHITGKDLTVSETWTNDNEVVMTGTTTAKLWNFKQEGNGAFRTALLKGRVGTFENGADFKATRSEGLTIQALLLKKNSVYTSQGNTTCDTFTSSGHFKWEDGTFEVRSALVGDATSHVTASGNFNIRAQKFQNKGKISSAVGLKMITHAAGNEMGVLDVTGGDTIYEGAGSASTFENTVWDKAQTSGNIRIDAPEHNFVLTKNVPLGARVLHVNVKSWTQHADLTTKSAVLKAKTVHVHNLLTTERDLTVAAETISVQGTVLSTDGSVTLTGLTAATDPRPTYAWTVTNRGTIETRQGLLRIQALTLHNLKTIASAHSASLETSTVTTGAGSSLSTPKLTLSTGTLTHSGTLQGWENSSVTVRDAFVDSQGSSFFLEKAHLTTPSEALTVQGKVHLRSPKSWNRYHARQYVSVPMNEHRFDVQRNASLVLENYNFKWSSMHNDGTLELLNSKAVGSGTYTASARSKTRYSGDFKLQGQKFDEYGETIVTDGGLRMICGGTVSHWGTVEANGNIEFEVPQNIPANVASENFKTIQFKRDQTPQTKTFTINAPQTHFHVDSNLDFGGNLRFQTASLTVTNTGALSAYSLALATSQHVVNTGQIQAETTLTLNGASLSNSGNGQISAKGDVRITLTGNLMNTGSRRARIFSQDGDLVLRVGGSITNTYAAMHAGGILDFEAAVALDNTAGHLQALDFRRESRFQAPTLKNSCFDRTETRWVRVGWTVYHTYTVSMGYKEIDRRVVPEEHGFLWPDTTTSPTSEPGKIYIAGDCHIIGGLESSCGNVTVCGVIYNASHQPLTNYTPTQLGSYVGTFTAHTARMSFNNFVSRGASFIIGPGGGYFESQGIARFYGGPGAPQMPTLTDLRTFAQQYPFYFERDPIGRTRLRMPETETRHWNVVPVTNRPLDPRRSVVPMMSLDAVLRTLTLLPLQSARLWVRNPEEFLLSAYTAAQNQSQNNVLTLQGALASQVPLLLGVVKENEDTQELHPLLVIPPSLPRVTGDLDTMGDMVVRARAPMTLVGARLHGERTLTLEAPEIRQIAGETSANENLVYKAPRTTLYVTRETHYEGTATTQTTRTVVKEKPQVRSRGTVTFTGAVAGTADMAARTLDFQGPVGLGPALETQDSHTVERKGKTRQTMTIHTETAVPSTLSADVVEFHQDAVLTTVHGQFGQILKHRGLRIQDHVLNNTAEGTAVKKGFFSTTRVHTSSLHQASAPSVINANVLKDMEAHGGPTVIRNATGKILNVQLTSDYIEETTRLQHRDTVDTKRSGFTCSWFSNPIPTLIQGLQGLAQARSASGLVTPLVQTATAAVQGLNDIMKFQLQGASYLPKFGTSLLSKVFSISFGTATTRQVVSESVPEQGSLHIQNMTVNNQRTQLGTGTILGNLSGHSDHVSITAPQRTRSVETTSRSTGVSFSPLGILRGPTGLAPSVQFSSGSSSSSTSRPENAGGGIQGGRLTTNRLTTQDVPAPSAVQAAHIEDTSVGPSSHAVTDNFTLGISFAHIQNQLCPVPSMTAETSQDTENLHCSIHTRHGLVLPLAEGLTLYNAKNEFILLRRQVLETLQAQGMNDPEAVAVVEKPEVKEKLKETATLEKQIQEEHQQISERFIEKEAEIVKRAKEVAADVDVLNVLAPNVRLSDLHTDEDLSLAQQIEINQIRTDYEQLQVETKQSLQSLAHKGFSFANTARKYAARFARSNPHAAKAILTGLHGLTDGLNAYATVQSVWMGAQLGAGMGGPAAPLTAVLGGVGGYYAVQGVGRAVASGLDEGLQATKKYAQSVATSEAEGAEFCESVEKLFEAGALVGALWGGKKLLTRRAATTATRAATAQVPAEVRAAVPYITSVNSALKLRTELAFKEAGILTQEGILTKRAITLSKEIPLKEGLKNPRLRAALEKVNADLDNWKKCRTQTIHIESMNLDKEIHFYKHKITGDVYLDMDFKVKDNIALHSDFLNKKGK